VLGEVLGAVLDVVRAAMRNLDSLRTGRDKGVTRAWSTPGGVVTCCISNTISCWIHELETFRP